jgi:GNAT superfamily N-acetyltransferase
LRFPEKLKILNKLKTITQNHNQMNIKIRKIEESDFAQLISLFHEFAIFEKSPEKMTNSLEQMIKEKEYLNGFVVFSDKNEIIGYATFFFTYHTWIGKSLYMDDLYIKQEYRSAGIGSKLINKVIDFAKTEKCKKLRWQVSEWNKPAIGFYEKLGAKIDNVQMNCDLLFNNF